MWVALAPTVVTMHWAGFLLLAVPAAALLPGYIPLSRAAAGCSAEARTRAEAALARLAEEAAGMAEQLAGRAETRCRAGLERAGRQCGLQVAGLADQLVDRGRSLIAGQARDCTARVGEAANRVGRLERGEIQQRAFKEEDRLRAFYQMQGKTAEQTVFDDFSARAGEVRTRLRLQFEERGREEERAMRRELELRGEMERLDTELELRRRGEGEAAIIAEEFRARAQQLETEIRAEFEARGRDAMQGRLFIINRYLFFIASPV